MATISLPNNEVWTIHNGYRNSKTGTIFNTLAGDVPTVTSSDPASIEAVIVPVSDGLFDVRVRGLVTTSGEVTITLDGSTPLTTFSLVMMVVAPAVSEDVPDERFLDPETAIKIAQPSPTAAPQTGA